MRFKRFALDIAFSLLGCVSAAANQYDESKTAALKRCETIDPAAYQSGLMFNPDGYRSFYLRSQCFQQTAIEFRDPALCDRVRQRRALASSSWGYSREQCEKQLRAGIAADRKNLEAKKQEYLQGAIRLQTFRVVRNGNGRDYDIIPLFTGTQKNSYLLRFEIVEANSGKETVLLHSSGYYLDGNNDIRIYLPVAEIRQRWPIRRLWKSCWQTSILQMQSFRAAAARLPRSASKSTKSKIKSEPGRMRIQTARSVAE
jgi:hypothetical protein